MTDSHKHRGRDLPLPFQVIFVELLGKLSRNLPKLLSTSNPTFHSQVLLALPLKYIQSLTTLPTYTATPFPPLGPPSSRSQTPALASHCSPRFILHLCHQLGMQICHFSTQNPRGFSHAVISHSPRGLEVFQHSKGSPSADSSH